MGGGEKGKGREEREGGELNLSFMSGAPRKCQRGGVVVISRAAPPGETSP